MADSSEGSDIDEVINSDFNEIMQVDTGPDLNDIPDDVDVPADRVVREQWIQAMFREGEEEMRFRWLPRRMENKQLSLTREDPV